MKESEADNGTGRIRQIHPQHLRYSNNFQSKHSTNTDGLISTPISSIWKTQRTSAISGNPS